MAFPLYFKDDRGVLRRYRWQEYPLMVMRPSPPRAYTWSEDPKQSPIEDMGIRTVVYCGPAAPHPLPPTADAFREAVMAWLFP